MVPHVVPCYNAGGIKTNADWSRRMARRFHPRSTPGENFRIASRLMPWKALLLLVVLITLAALVFQFATHLGNNVLPGVTQLFYKLSAPPPLPTPTPFPAFPSALPQAGSILYTVQEGDRKSTRLNSSH